MIKQVGAFLATVAAVAVLTTGCYQAPVMPPVGWVYSEFTAPLDYDQETSLVGERAGRASSMSILGLVALGDCSINTAARQGGITTLHGADYEFFNVLGVYQKFTVVVRGE
ncbi:MAG: TRL-like family protein [Candidatus Sumerlaeia bacterium]|nr:TRL-like family protein [Candidatus Sumerlaeia bacterium]